MADSSSDSEAEKTIADDVVVTKYKMAGAMNDKVMRALIPKCIAGASALDLCKFGDEQIAKQASTVFKKEKDMLKGVAFPTCISVNSCVCHYSPLESEKEVDVLADGDMVKIDLGCHIDGFIASAAHTLVVGATKDNPVTGRKADALKAAYTTAEAAIRLVKAGNKTTQVTDAFDAVAKDFKCSPVEGMLSHQLKQNQIDGEKTVISNPTEKQKQDHEESEFEVHDVYAMDCFVSTGDGHARERGTRTTIYKRNPEVVYQLKMKNSRAVFSEIEKKHDTMCFTLRSLEDEKRAKMGIVECCKHELCIQFPVVYEKEGEHVAQFKYTILLMPNGPLRITTNLFDPTTCNSEYDVENPEMKTLLQSSVSRRAAKKKKKKALSKAAAENNNGTVDSAIAAQ